MRFHILGIGPIGSLLAHHLRRVVPPAHSITLIHKTRRQAQAANINGGVIRVERDGTVIPAGDFKSEIFELSSEEMERRMLLREGFKKGTSSSGRGGERGPDKTIEENTQKIESLFITTKAHQTLPAILRLLPRISKHSTIVLLQNGLGVYEQLVHKVFRNPQQRPQFILASNTHGAWLKSYYNVVHAGIGEITFGIVPDPLGHNFEAALLNEGVPQPERKLSIEDIAVSASDPAFARYRTLRQTVAMMCNLEDLHVSWKPMADVQVAMRRKLVVNAVINPLTALMGCRNGDIFTTDAASRILDRVCQEAAEVYAAQLQAETKSWLETLPKQDAASKNLPLGRIPLTLTRSSLKEECLRVASVTKGNISSMLSDIQKGRHTEVDFMNGYLLNLGSTFGVPMPATAMLLNLIKMRSAIPLDQML